MGKNNESALAQLIQKVSQPPLPKRKPIISDPFGVDETESFPPEFYGATTESAIYGQQEPLLGKKPVAPKAAVAQKFNPLQGVLSKIGNYAMLPVTAMNSILESILKSEGGVANYKEDKGGYTNMGITAKALAEYKGVPVAKVSTKDLDAVTPTQAKDIYKTMYIDKAGYSDVDDKDVLHLLADMSVHHGRSGSATLTQKALRRLGYNVSVDGDFGPKSKAALKDALEKKGKDVLMSTLVTQRKARFNEIIKKDPTQKKFIGGWVNRANSFLPKNLKETKDG